MKISSIVAMNPKGIIGFENQIPWYLPADLKYFKKVTKGHCILMGRKCYESIGKPLPLRTNIIVTRDPYFIVSNCLIAHSINEGLYLAQKSGESELFIIGGGEIYKQTAHLWNRLYITKVAIDCEGDTFFPELEMNEWTLISEQHHTKDDLNEMNYSFLVFDKK
ncbi:MAG: dihydrofolate reductase [Saprospiraceae bacterium]|nr:dihydrofolate reductase [Saprospiraceae bacterium]